MKLGVGSYCVSWRNEFETDVAVGNFTSIARGFEILVGGACNHAPAIWPNAVTNSPFAGWGWDYHDHRPLKGRLRIGHDVWIGSGATVVSVPDVSIGNGAIIGARSVVTRDVPPFAIVAGTPAKVLRFRFDREFIEALDRIQWWNWHVSEIRNRSGKFKDIAQFVAEFDPLRADGKSQTG